MNDLVGMKVLERLRVYPTPDTTCSTERRMNHSTSSGVGMGRCSGTERSPRGQYSMSVYRMAEGEKGTDGGPSSCQLL